MIKSMVEDKSVLFTIALFVVYRGNISYFWWQPTIYPNPSKLMFIYLSLYISLNI